MYYFVERSVVVIKPKQPFLDWLHVTFNDLKEQLNLENIRIDCNTYLISEVHEIEDGINIIDERYNEFFMLELASWTNDESLWPKDISLKTFWEYFDVEIHPTLIDMTDENQEQTEEKEDTNTIH